MQRGTRTFQFLLFTQNEATEAVAEKRAGGRDPILVEKRNQLIAHRYYYYARMLRKNYPDTLDHLCNEFFISEYQLVNRVIGNALATLAQLKREDPTVQYFRKKYPFMVWNDLTPGPSPKQRGA